MTAFLLLKGLHILSSTILFGTGLGTAFHMWLTHKRGDVHAIAVTTRNVVLADWLFTAPSGIIQPLTGVGLVFMAGHDPGASWLVLTYVLYAVAGACWLIVVRLQILMADISRGCAATGAPLPEPYFRLIRVWFWLGWPAFLGLVGIFWLMVSKPTLW